jgi:hypothetical protein
MSPGRHYHDFVYGTVEHDDFLRHVHEFALCRDCPFGLARDAEGVVRLIEDVGPAGRAYQRQLIVHPLDAA